VEVQARAVLGRHPEASAAHTIVIKQAEAHASILTHPEFRAPSSRRVPDDEILGLHGALPLPARHRESEDAPQDPAEHGEPDRLQSVHDARLPQSARLSADGT
jgi:hypothetical protein